MLWNSAKIIFWKKSIFIIIFSYNLYVYSNFLFHKHLTLKSKWYIYLIHRESLLIETQLIAIDVHSLKSLLKLRKPLNYL